MKLLGLRTLIHPSDNLEADRAWWSDVPSVKSYFGLDISRYEFKFDPVRV